MAVDITDMKALLEGEMVDSVAIVRPGEGEVMDPDTLVYVPGASTSVYSGKAIVSTRDATAREYVQAGLDITEQSYDVSVPLGSEVFRRGDIVQVTAAVRDSGMTGLRLRVVAVQHDTFAISRDLICEVDR